MELTYDSADNSLRLTPNAPDATPPPVSKRALAGILDVGEGGQLIGIEFNATSADLTLWHSGAAIQIDGSGRAYVEITQDSGGNARSTTLQLTAEYDADGHITAITIPRHGDGYEITYPSGNQ